MNKYGLIYNKIHNTAVNGEDFKTCLIELKNQCLAAGIGDPVFILDNARIHHYKGLNETISELNLKLCYLPLYKPFFESYRKYFFCLEESSDKSLCKE